MHLVRERAHRLRWEVHGRVVDMLLEFERASFVGQGKEGRDATEEAVLHAAAQKLLQEGTGGCAPGVTTVEGIVCGYSAPHWPALEFSTAERETKLTHELIHAVPVYRDNQWVRLPVALLVRGDMIALMQKESPPGLLKPLDGLELGQRGNFFHANNSAALQLRLAHSRLAGPRLAPTSRAAERAADKAAGGGGGGGGWGAASATGAAALFPPAAPPPGAAGAQASGSNAGGSGAPGDPAWGSISLGSATRAVG